MCGILLREPFDLVNFFLYLQALEIVELRLVALEGTVDVVLTLAVRRILTLHENHTGLSCRTGQGGWECTREGARWSKPQRAQCNLSISRQEHQKVQAKRNYSLFLYFGGTGV